MVVSVKMIRLVNFKSYPGDSGFITLKQYVSVVGPNGSGKTNYFMDAIAFVFGDTSEHRRVRHDGDYVHGSVAHQASVSVVLSLEDGSEKVFKRCVSVTNDQATLTYFVDDNVSTRNFYLGALKRGGVDIKSNVFLMYQDMLQRLSIMDPLKIAEYLEEISGSRAFKKEYVRLDSETLVAREKLQGFVLEHAYALARVQQCQYDTEQARQYDLLKVELKMKLHDLNILYHLYVHQYAAELPQQEAQLLRAIDTKRAKITRLNEFIASDRDVDKHREVGEKKIRELEMEENKLKAEHAGLEKIFIRCNKRFKSAENALEQATLADTKHNTAIQELEQNDRNLAVQLGAVVLELADVSDQSAAQEAQYRQTQLNMLAETPLYMKKKADIVLRQNSVREQLNDCTLILGGETELEQRQLYEAKTVLEVMTNKVAALEKERDDKEEELRGMRQASQRIQVVRQELQEVLQDLHDSTFYQEKALQQEKRNETCAALQRLHPGVIGRMARLCTPIDQEHKHAVKYIMSRYCDAIVVDDNSTADLCKEYLAKDGLDQETFMPLADLKVPKKNKGKIEIAKSLGCTLAMELVVYSPQIKKAVKLVFRDMMIVTSNVHEDPEIMNMTYGLNVILLDGRYFETVGTQQKRGLFKTEPEPKYNVARLTDDKKRLMDELRNLKRDHNDEDMSELIKDLAFVKKKLDLNSEHLRTIEHYVTHTQAALQQKRFNFRISTDTLRQEMDTLKEEMCDIEMSIRDVKELKFADFCMRWGVADIGAYEQARKRAEELRKQRNDLKTQLTRGRKELEVLRCRDTASVVPFKQQALAETKRLMVEAKQSVTAHEAVLEATRTKLRECVEADDSLTSSLTPKNVITTYQNQLKAADKKLRKLRRELAVSKSQLAVERRGCREILRQCEEENIDVAIDLSNAADTEQDLEQLSERVQLLRDTVTKMSADAKVIKPIWSTADTAKAMLEAQQDCALKSGRMCDAAEVMSQLLDKFNQVRRSRLEAFNSCLKFLQANVDSVYKELSGKDDAHAVISVQSDEPYLTGVHYILKSSDSSYEPMAFFGGGEKMMAALSLCFTLNSFRPPFLIVLDEIDASLDVDNLVQVATYLRRQCTTTQIIAISQRMEFAAHADATIAIHTTQGEDNQLQTKFIGLSLGDYS